MINDLILYDRINYKSDNNNQLGTRVTITYNNATNTGCPLSRLYTQLLLTTDPSTVNLQKLGRFSRTVTLNVLVSKLLDQDFQYFITSICKLLNLIYNNVIM